MVHALFTSPPFCIYLTLRRRWNESSCYLFFCLICFRNFDMYSLFIFWKLVEHNQPLFFLRCLDSFHLPSFLLPCLIFSSIVLLRWSIKKYRLTVDFHTALNLVVLMIIDEMGYVAEAKFFPHCICKHI